MPTTSQSNPHSASPTPTKSYMMYDHCCMHSTSHWWCGECRRAKRAKKAAQEFELDQIRAAAPQTTVLESDIGTRYGIPPQPSSFDNYYSGYSYPVQPMPVVVMQEPDLLAQIISAEIVADAVVESAEIRAEERREEMGFLDSSSSSSFDSSPGYDSAPSYDLLPSSDSDSGSSSSSSFDFGGGESGGGGASGDF